MCNSFFFSLTSGNIVGIRHILLSSMPFGPMYILPTIQRAALATVTWLLHATKVLIIVVGPTSTINHFIQHEIHHPSTRTAIFRFCPGRCMDLLPVAAFLLKNFPPFTFPLLSFSPFLTKSASLPFIASLFSSLRAFLLTVVLYLLLPFLYLFCTICIYVYVLLGFVCVTNIDSLIPISVIYGCPFLLLSSSSDRFLCYSILKD
jgi:hypothetical protein